MNHRVMAVVVAAGLLGGCSTSFLDNALEFPSTTDRKDGQAAPTDTAAVPEYTAPTTVAVAKTAPFVTVPEAPPLGSTDEAHRSLRAGTAMVVPPPAPPPPAVVPLPDITPPARAKAVARAEPIAPPAPPPIAPVAPKPERTAARVAPPPAAAPSYTPPAPTPTAQPSYTPPPPVAPPTYTAVAQAPAAPVAQSSEIPSAPDSWCVRVAKSAQAEAADQGFDAATQQRRALTTFKQCSANAH
jgi:hypothetical protein